MTRVVHALNQIYVQSNDGGRRRPQAHPTARGTLAAVADEVVAADTWWGQLGGNSVEEQLLADLQKDGAPRNFPPLRPYLLRTNDQINDLYASCFCGAITAVQKGGKHNV